MGRVWKTAKKTVLKGWKNGNMAYLAGKKIVKLLHVIQKIENISNELWDSSNNISRQSAERISGSYYLHIDKGLQERERLEK